jgi:L-amino acid N-acyltransferase YncA
MATLRFATEADAPAFCEIYNHYVLNSLFTFEEVALSVEEMAGRIRDITEKLPWVVLEDEGRIVGYAYAGPWKNRTAYRFSVESTIYVTDGISGRGYGSILYERLIAELRSRQVHVVLGGIVLPNDPSVALHEKFGFRQVARIPEVGWKFEQWVDVGYWQLIL